MSAPVATPPQSPSSSQISNLENHTGGGIITGGKFPTDPLLTNATAYNEALLECAEELSQANNETRRRLGINPEHGADVVCKDLFSVIYPEGKPLSDKRDTDTKRGIWPINTDSEETKGRKTIDSLKRQDAKDKFEAGLVQCSPQSSLNSTVSKADTKREFGSCIKDVTDEYSANLITIEKSKSEWEMGLPKIPVPNPKDSLREPEYLRLDKNFLGCRLRFLGEPPLTTTKDGKQSTVDFQDCIGLSTQKYVRVLDWINYGIDWKNWLLDIGREARTSAPDAQNANDTETNSAENDLYATDSSATKPSPAVQTLPLPLAGLGPAVLKRVDDIVEAEEYRAYMALIPKIK